METLSDSSSEIECEKFPPPYQIILDNELNNVGEDR